MSGDVGTLAGQKTLADLFMQTGPVADILGADEKTWIDAAAKLRSVFLPWQQGLKEETDRAKYVAYLGKVFYGHGKARHIHPMNDATYTDADTLTATVDLLEKFMIGNGQWGYLKSQDWYLNGDYVISVDVNFYPDRSGFKDSVKFHKDTGGNNVFVNLIFDNKTEIEATEWFADTQQPGVKRTEWQANLLPERHLQALTQAREVLRGQAAQTENPEVSGGVSEGRNTYVSWVDDLVWHSTPSATLRAVCTAQVAADAYAGLDANFWSYDNQLKIYILGAELLGTMAENPKTHVSGWLQKNNKTAGDLDETVGKQAWQELYAGAGKSKFTEDAETRAGAPWRIMGVLAVASAKDDNLPGSATLTETPVGLSTIRRANSLPRNQAALARARAASANEPRTFLRTWVRILPKNSTELTGTPFEQK